MAGFQIQRSQQVNCLGVSAARLRTWNWIYNEPEVTDFNGSSVNNPNGGGRVPDFGEGDAAFGRGVAGGCVESGEYSDGAGVAGDEWGDLLCFAGECGVWKLKMKN